MRLTGKHLGDGWRDVDVRQALVAAGMEEPQRGAVVQGDPDARTAGIRHAGNGAARVAAHDERVLDVERVRVEDFDAVVAAAPEFPSDRQHSRNRRRYRADGHRRWIRRVPSTGWRHVRQKQ